MIMQLRNKKFIKKIFFVNILPIIWTLMIQVYRIKSHGRESYTGISKLSEKYD